MKKSLILVLMGLAIFVSTVYACPGMHGEDADSEAKVEAEKA